MPTEGKITKEDIAGILFWPIFGIIIVLIGIYFQGPSTQQNPCKKWSEPEKVITTNDGVVTSVEEYIDNTYCLER